MDASINGSSGAHQQLGISYLFRDIPVALCSHSRRLAVRHLMDWIHPNLSSLFDWYLLRQSPRCRLLPRCARFRLSATNPRSLHDVDCKPVLAAISSSRGLQRVGRWIGLLPDSLPCGDLLLQKPCGGYGVYCVWRCDRWHYFPSHGTAIAFKNWICLDSPDHGFCDILKLSDCAFSRSGSPSTTSRRTVFGVECFQGGTLHIVLCGHVLQSMGSVLCLLLRESGNPYPRINAKVSYH